MRIVMDSIWEEETSNNKNLNGKVILSEEVIDKIQTGLGEINL